MKSEGCGPCIGAFLSSILLLKDDSLLLVKSKNIKLWRTEKHFDVLLYPLVTAQF